MVSFLLEWLGDVHFSLSSQAKKQLPQTGSFILKMGQKIVTHSPDQISIFSFHAFFLHQFTEGQNENTLKTEKPIPLAPLLHLFMWRHLKIFENQLPHNFWGNGNVNVARLLPCFSPLRNTKSAERCSCVWLPTEVCRIFKSRAIIIVRIRYLK